MPSSPDWDADPDVRANCARAMALQQLETGQDAAALLIGLGYALLAIEAQLDDYLAAIEATHAA